MFSTASAEAFETAPLCEYVACLLLLHADDRQVRWRTLLSLAFGPSLPRPPARSSARASTGTPHSYPPLLYSACEEATYDTLAGGGAWNAHVARIALAPPQCLARAGPCPALFVAIPTFNFTPSRRRAHRRVLQHFNKFKTAKVGRKRG